MAAEVPGTHIPMMASPQLACLAERLEGVLAAASAHGRSPTMEFGQRMVGVVEC